MKLLWHPDSIIQDFISDVAKASPCTPQTPNMLTTGNALIFKLWLQQSPHSRQWVELVTMPSLPYSGPTSFLSTLALFSCPWSPLQLTCEELKADWSRWVIHLPPIKTGIYWIIQVSNGSLAVTFQDLRQKFTLPVLLTGDVRNDLRTFWLTKQKLYNWAAPLPLCGTVKHCLPNDGDS